MRKTELDPAGVNHEIEFWKGFVQSERFLKGWVPEVPTPELNPTVRRLLEIKAAESPVKIRVLDVGSGPVSILRGLDGYVPVTMDPLSELYQQVFDFAAHNIEPPLPYAAEDAADAVDEHTLGNFRVVHISNALDHVVNVEQALHSLAACLSLSESSWLVVQGFVNESSYEHQAGFHKHDLQLGGDDGLRVTSYNRPDIYDKTITPSDLGLDLVWREQKKLETLGREWFVWILGTK